MLLRGTHVQPRVWSMRFQLLKLVFIFSPNNVYQLAAGQRKYSTWPGIFCFDREISLIEGQTLSTIDIEEKPDTIEQVNSNSSSKKL